VTTPGTVEPARTGGDVRQIRDVVIWGDAGEVHVAACDANAAIGERPEDSLRRPPDLVGYSAAKVPLMEVIATGARPFLLLNTLCGPLDHYGGSIVAGIYRAISETGYEVFVTGSDETNMPTVQTGVGITVIGAARDRDLLIGRARPDDVVLCAGTPRDGLVVPYEEGQPGVASLRHLAAVARSGLAREILPVGSRGILYELEQLARTASLEAALLEPEVVGTESPDGTVLDLTASAGASTCFLVAAPLEAVADLEALVDLPFTPVARLRAGQGPQPAPGGGRHASAPEELARGGDAEP
jgi:hypothetical protein